MWSEGKINLLLCCFLFSPEIKINKALSVLSRLINGWKITKVIKLLQYRVEP